MKLPRTLLPLLFLTVFAPVRLLACAACGSANPELGSSSMVNGMNLGILTLLGILVVVLGAFLTFLIYAIRKSEALTVAAERQTSPNALKV